MCACCELTKVYLITINYPCHNTFIFRKQGRKRPLDTPKRMIERSEREVREKKIERKKGRRRYIERN